MSRARAHPDLPAYVFLSDGDNESDRVTYAEIDRRARAVGARLREVGSPGDRVLITYPSDAGLPYVVSFLGCLYAGMVAVPCDAPQGRAGRERLGWVARDAAPTLVLRPAEQDNAAGTNPLTGRDVVSLDVTDVPDDAADEWRNPALEPEMLALLQYTSGSTRTPRGVMVTHANVMANERAIATTCEHDDASVFVGWLPLFHDMGMIANVLQPIYLGSTSVLLPPTTFLAKPGRWLAAISRYRGVTGGGPNFGYDLCVSRISEEEIESLDLSSWRVAFNGAEVIRAGTLRRFTEKFAPAGFAPQAFFCCYGLAEATLIVAGAPRGRPPEVLRVSPAALGQGRLLPVDQNALSQRVVSSGRPVHATDIVIDVAAAAAAGAIVEPGDASATVANGPDDGVLGEICIRGPGVAAGYWGQEAQSIAVFGAQPGAAPQDRLLRTGDLGAIVDGELYVVGRIKDLVIIRGQNFYPDDLEWTSEQSHPSLRRSCAAAFSVDVDDDERLVIACEVAEAGEIDPEVVAASMRQAVSERYHIDVFAVALVRRGCVPKTTSGKVRRRACREAYLHGALPLVGHSIKGLAARPVTSLPDLELLADQHHRMALASAIRDAVASQAGIPANLVDLDQPLTANGLDSVGAIELAHEISRRYGIDLAPMSLLGGASAETLAAEVLTQVHAGGIRHEVSGANSAPSVDSGPLTMAQAAMWYESQLAPPGPAYSLARAVRLRGAFDKASFDRAARRLVEHHPALRTQIRLAGDDPVQVIADGASLEPEHVDASDAMAGAISSRLHAETERGFDPAATLFRLTVLRIAEEEHVVLLAAHHVVVDLWSFVIVLRDLFDLYAAESRGEPLAPAPLPVSMIDYARQEAAMIDSTGGARAQEYWRTRLADAPTALALPHDRPRPARRSFRGRSHPLRIDADLTGRCGWLARQQHTTLFTVILTAFQVVLARQCAQSDVVVGVLASNRDSAAVAGLVGCLVNPVPIRTRLRRRESFRELVRRVRDDVLCDLSHGRYPFAEIVRQLDPPRVPGEPPLVQALLAFQRAQGPRDDGLLAVAMNVAGEARLGGTGVVVVPVRQTWTHVDLTLNIAEIGGELVGAIDYDPAVFDEPTISALAGSFAHLLRCVVGEPDRPLAEFATVAADERTALAAAGRGPARQRMGHLGLHDLVLRRIPQSADAIAVTAAGADGATHHLSYRALRRGSTAVARRLVEAGVGAETRVGILLDRCLALPVAMLGVLRLGAAYVPLDPDEPPERLAWIISDANIETIVTASSLRSRLPTRPLTVIEVDLADEPRTAGAAPVVADPATSVVISRGVVDPKQAAYVSYTSGSTGRPKGVVITHEGIVNRLLWMQEAFALSPADRVAHKAPTTFDVSVWELFWPLSQGACLILVPPGDHRDPGVISDVFRREQVTTAHFVPSLLSVFLAGKGAEHLPALARAMCSGETLSARLRDDVHRNLRARLVNLYGPTEAAIDVTAFECRPGDAGAVPIGVPIANTEVHVLDDRLHPVPANVRGEIYIGGVCLARGYLNRPGLTAATFVPDLLGGHGHRLYRSGDHALRRRDGTIVYIGRVDDQVKIAGNRIELGEVTEVLRLAPGVRDAAVTVIDEGDGPRLAGYVVGATAAEAGIDVPAIRRWLRQRLPASMVPTDLVALDRLPTTSGGKLDRRGLPMPVVALAESKLPATGAERRIAAVWSRVLGVGRIDPDVDFFALGGDSIRVLRLVAALRGEGVMTSVAELTAGATVRSLGATLISPSADADGIEDEPAPFALCPVEAREGFDATVEDAYPVTRAQQAVLFHQLHNPGHETYVTRLTVRARFNGPALRSAADAALRRHPYLRSFFDLTSTARPLQVVRRMMPAPISLADLRDVESVTANQVLADWLRRERKRAVNVDSGPLARFSVHRLTNDTFSLTLSSFALDGWCTATVLTEFLVDYAAFTRGEPSSVPPPATSYPTFVDLEQRALDSGEQRAFWRRELSGAPTCLVPGRAGAQPAPLTRRRVLRIKPEVAARLRRVAHDLGVPLKSAMLAAHVRVVRLLTAQATVLTGLEVNGRPERVDADRVVGVFNNIVPLRLTVEVGSWAELVRAAWSAERRISRYRRFPLAELDRAYRVSSQFNTLFVFTHFHLYQQLATLPDIALVSGEAPDRTYVALTAHVNIDAITGEQRVLLDYDPGEISEDLAAATLGYYERALTHLSLNPERPPSADVLLGPAEVARLLRLGTSTDGTDTGPAPGSTVHGEILGQAARTPDAIAVAAGGENVTYRALARRSLALAATVHAAGVGPESLVALLCDGGVAQVIAILAILRAGGAYVPIDVRDGSPRVAGILSRLGITVAVGTPAAEPLLPPDCRLILAGEPHRTAAPGQLPRIPASALAYCLHTSGSTGRPKAIGVPHGALVNYLRWCARAYLPGGGSRTLRALTHTPVTFDLSVTSLLAPLVVGATVEILPSGAGPEALGNVLSARGGVDLLKITPAHFEALGWQLRHLGAAVGVGCAVIGGEQLRAHHLKPWTDVATAHEIINEYGPTEATVGCCAHRREPDDAYDPVPIGQPIAGARAVVLDDGSLVPVAVAGELHIGGPGLARGYLREPGLTARQFTPDPYGAGERLYRTGDLAFVGRDGLLRFVGRRDRQIKIRGFRVEPAEIEQELRQHSAVHAVAVAGHLAADGRVRLVAYWVPRANDDRLGRSVQRDGGVAGDDPGLRTWLSRRLPAHLVPDVFVPLPVLPLTGRGKVDYARLPDPTTTRRELLLALAEAITDDATRGSTMEGRSM